MASILPNVAFTTSGSLVDSVDKKVLVVLRDGRKVIGILRSYDQFANLVLQDTVERLHAGSKYAEKPIGLFVVRGENVVLLGEIDLDLEDVAGNFERVQPSEQLLSQVSSNDKSRETRKKNEERFLKDNFGFIPESAEGDNY